MPPGASTRTPSRGAPSASTTVPVSVIPADGPAAGGAELSPIDRVTSCRVTVAPQPVNGNPSPGLLVAVVLPGSTVPWPYITHWNVAWSNVQRSISAPGSIGMGSGTVIFASGWSSSPPGCTVQNVVAAPGNGIGTSEGGTLLRLIGPL